MVKQGPYHRLYTKNRWLSVRKQHLMKEPLCRFCLARGLVTLATVADHVVLHHGEQQAFWEGELQSLCASCHSGTKRKTEEQEKRGWIDGVGPDGMPLDRRHPAWAEH
jgi:5-methylcytosine-specific restriction endonuclease McrA